MKKLLTIFFIFNFSFFICSARADTGYDVEDPMFILSATDFLSRTGLSMDTESILKISQKFAYGLNNRLSVGASFHYQQDFDGPEDGFSNIDLSGTYRLSAGSEDSRIISDALFGVKINGNDRVRDPEFADTVWYAGLRVGRQWSGITLAGTVKTSWIFDETRGMAYIDFIPEAYFRFDEKWKMGIGMDFRVATNPNFDQEWVNFKFLRQYGRTQYVGHVDYEIESDEWQFGARVNIVF